MFFDENRPLILSNFNLAYLLSSLIVIYSNELTRKLIKRIYLASFAIENRFMKSVFPKPVFLIGKFFNLLSQNKMDMEIVENIYELLLENAEFRSFYASGKLKDFFEIFVNCVDKIMCIPFTYFYRNNEAEFSEENIGLECSNNSLEKKTCTSLIKSEFEGGLEMMFECPTCKLEIKTEKEFGITQLTKLDCENEKEVLQNRNALSQIIKKTKSMEASFLKTIFRNKLEVNLNDILFKHFYGQNDAQKIARSVFCGNCNKSFKSIPENRIKFLPNNFTIYFEIQEKEIKNKSKIRMSPEIDLEWLRKTPKYIRSLVKAESDISKSILSGWVGDKFSNIKKITELNSSQKISNINRNFEMKNKYSLSCFILASENENSSDFTTYFRKKNIWMECKQGSITQIEEISEVLEGISERILFASYLINPKINEKISDFSDSLSFKMSKEINTKKEMRLPIGLVYRYLYRSIDFGVNFSEIYCEHLNLKPNLEDFKSEECISNSILPEMPENGEMETVISKLKNVLKKTDGKYTSIVFNSLSIKVSMEVFLKILYKENILDEIIIKKGEIECGKTCKDCSKLIKQKVVNFIFEKSVFQNLISQKKAEKEGQFLIEKDWHKFFLKFISWIPNSQTLYNWEKSRPCSLNRDINKKLIQYREFYSSDPEIILKFFVAVNIKTITFFYIIFGVDNFLRLKDGMILVDNNMKIDVENVFENSEKNIIAKLAQKNKSKLLGNSTFEKLIKFDEKLSTFQELALIEYKRKMEITENGSENYCNFRLMNKLQILKNKNDSEKLQLNACKVLNELLMSLENDVTHNKDQNNKSEDFEIEESINKSVELNSSANFENSLCFSGLSGDAMGDSRIHSVHNYGIDRSEEFYTVEQHEIDNKNGQTGKMKLYKEASETHKNKIGISHEILVPMKNLVESVLADSSIFNLNEQQQTLEKQNQIRKSSLASVNLNELINSILVESVKENIIDVESPNQELKDLEDSSISKSEHGENIDNKNHKIEPEKINLSQMTKKSHFCKPELNQLNESLIEQNTDEAINLETEDFNIMHSNKLLKEDESSLKKSPEKFEIKPWKSEINRTNDKNKTHFYLNISQSPTSNQRSNVNLSEKESPVKINKNQVKNIKEKSTFSENQFGKSLDLNTSQLCVEYHCNLDMKNSKKQAKEVKSATKSNKIERKENV